MLTKLSYDTLGLYKYNTQHQRQWKKLKVSGTYRGILGLTEKHDKIETTRQNDEDDKSEKNRDWERERESL